MKEKFYYLFLVGCLLLCGESTIAQPFGYSYVKEISIQESQIPDGASLTDFPFLVKLTDNDLRTVGNGGHVRNSNGYDIIFYLNGCVTKLDHQLEDYDSVTGSLSAWVRIPVLSTTSNTSVYMYYGNGAVSSSTSTSSVWASSYSGVWHLTENPGGTAPQMSDATSNAHHGTSYGSMGTGNSVTGKIGRAISFDETNDHIRIPDFLYGQELTVSFWFNLSEVNGNSYQYLFSHGTWATQNSLNVYMGEDNITIPAEIPNRNKLKTNFRDSNDANNFDTLDAGNTMVDGNWHYYTIRIQDFGGATIYIDGTAVVTYSVWGANSFNPPTDIYLGGREDLHAQRFYGGILDEVRISSVWKTSNWIRTEFNNQNNPATFASVGPEGPAVSFCAPLSVRLYGFDAFRLGSAVKLRWSIDGQNEAVQYQVERSADNHQWELVGFNVNGTSFTDSFPPAGTLYYRVEYKHGGKTNLSAVRKVNGSEAVSGQIRLYPNPLTAGHLVVEIPGQQRAKQVRVYSAIGRLIRTIPLLKSENGLMQLDLPGALGKGIYILQFEFDDRTENLKVILQ